MCHFNCDTGSCELSPTYRISNKQYQKRVLSFFYRLTQLWTLPMNRVLTSMHIAFKGNS